jgi:hypothetical protein
VTEPLSREEMDGVKGRLLGPFQGIGAHTEEELEQSYQDIGRLLATVQAVEAERDLARANARAWLTRWEQISAAFMRAEAESLDIAVYAGPWAEVDNSVRLSAAPMRVIPKGGRRAAEQVAKAVAERDALAERVERLREALDYYADVMKGAVARAAMRADDEAAS